MSEAVAARDAALPAHVLAVWRESREIHSPAAVEAAIARMADAIREDLAGQDPLVLSVLIGALVPVAMLLPQLDFPLQLDCVHATRYRGETRGAELQWRSYPSHSLQGRHVLLVDDILDEGLTLAALMNWCREQGAASVRVAVLAEKQHERNHSGIRADYTGLTVPDAYVFGSGMDYRDYLRNVPGIRAVDDKYLKAGGSQACWR